MATYAEKVKIGKDESMGRMIADIAIIAAATNPGYEIDFVHLIPNLANGNCAAEAVTDQLNNSRNSDTNSDFSTCGAGRFEDPQALRAAVVDDLTKNRLAQTKVGKSDDPEGYRKEVEQLKVPGVWNIEAGDLFLPGIAFTTRKTILVYNTNPNNGFCPISVVSPSELGGTTDSDIPIVLCYSGSHYEGLLPNTEDDVVKTIELVEAYSAGYNVTAHDIPILKEQLPQVELQEEEVLQLAIRESQLQRVREEELERDKARELDIAIRQSQITAEKTAAKKDAADKADAVKAEAEKAAAEKAAVEKTAAEKVDKEKSDAEMAAAEKAAAEKADAEKAAAEKAAADRAAAEKAAADKAAAEKAAAENAAADKAAAEKAAAAKAAAEKAKAEKKLLHKKNRQARKSRQDRDESRRRGRKGQSNGQELNNDDKVAKLS